MPTSGRYQSRFFSFLSKQSLRLRDKTSQAWRQVQIATAWGAQIVLYPIYLAFQTSRLVSRQLQQKVSQVLPQLQAAGQPDQPPDRSPDSQPLLAADTPIQNTLEAVKAMVQSLPASPTLNSLLAGTTLAGTTETGAIEPASPPSLAASPHSSLSPSPHSPIQAVASLLATHSLVLVTSNNQILDILTDEQQLYLQRRIVWEMTAYWQQQRNLQGSLRPANFLPLPSDRPNALLPIRGFYRLMTWMQTSPIARATNLFQENQLAALYAGNSHVVAALPASEHSLQKQLPRSAALPWLSLEAAFSGLFDRSTHQSRNQLANQSASQSSAPISSWRDRLRHWLRIDKTEIVHLPSAPSPASQPASSQPWLTWESLFGNRSFPASAKSTADWELFDQPAANSNLAKRNPSSIKRTDRRTASISPLSETEATLLTVLASETLESETLESGTLESGPLEPKTSSPLAASEPHSQDEAVLSNTWIEAEVKLVAYVKHPLEQVLEWLDRGMVWIEEKVAHVVAWLRDRLH